MLRARTYLRAGSMSAAIDELDHLPDSDQHREQAEAAILRAAVFTRERRMDEAAAKLTDARVYAFGSGDGAIEAELHYYEALWHFANEDLDAMAASANEALSVEDVLGRERYFVPIENSRARGFQALVAVEASSGRYANQAGLLRRAVAELAEASTPDVWVEAALLHHSSVVTRDLDLVDDEPALREKAATLPWSTATIRYQFLTRQALGWCRALRGDHIGAFRDFRGAVDVAPSRSLRVSALLDQAYLARELANIDVSRETLGFAVELSEQIRWEDTADDERVALLDLAEGLAQTEAPRARRIYESYRALKGSMSVLAVAKLDKRVYAQEAYVRGIVARGEGNTAAAIEHVRNALSTWIAIGFDWRAGLAAADLVELGMTGPAAIARREAERRPSSWLARRVAKVLSPT
ncbi:MAG: hypothetical protein IAI50_09265 [Candidatus Eremiobacteraeota bacterium]|nr:hypothetical protein [Candidatus Eremiobacteraeota bacterium]